MSSARTELRDAAKPASHYTKLAGLYEKEIAHSIAMKSRQLTRFIADRELRVVRALYSGGAPLSECLTHLTAAGDHFTQFLTDSRGEAIEGIPDVESFIENMSAVFLCGAGSACERAFRAAQIDNVRPWQSSVLSLVAAVLDGKTSIPHPLDLQGTPKDWAPLFTDMFQTVLRRDHDAFPAALKAYFAKSWGPSADRAARGDLKAKPCCYVGKWAFHAAALCKLMGGAPPLSQKLLQYVPVELVTAAVPRGLRG